MDLHKSHLKVGWIRSRCLMRAATGILLVCLAANSLEAASNDFRMQMITLPVSAMAAHFSDIDNDGRSDLLALDPVGKKLLIYRQRPTGFPDIPDQVIQIPPETAWIASWDVEAHPGVELLLSTPTGLAYHRQNDGVFELERRTLIKADQVFTKDDLPVLVSSATNGMLPVIAATQAVLFARNNVFDWKPGAQVALEMKRQRWTSEQHSWTTGVHSSRSMLVQQSLLAYPGETDDEKPENDAIKKLITEMKKAGPRHVPGMNRVDVDGDGRKDFVLWQVLGDADARTDIYVYLRGADNKLPERPTQLLHCNGFPIPFGATQKPSPIGDLKGDGRYELVLLELKSMITSASGVVEMALTRGLDWSLAIRTFNGGVFSRSPDVTVVMTTILTLEPLEQWPIFIFGDFNGDGRPDIALRRSATQWNILFSTNDARWFVPQPAITFDVPTPGFFKVEDLNGDRRADILVRAKDDPRLFIFLSQAPKAKGNR